MGLWLLRLTVKFKAFLHLTVKFLALLRLTFNFFPLRLTEILNIIVNFHWFGAWQNHEKYMEHSRLTKNEIYLVKYISVLCCGT